jgi:poly(hydroxyalkanoate) depolymerase family esterase
MRTGVVLIAVVSCEIFASGCGSSSGGGAASASSSAPPGSDASAAPSDAGTPGRDGAPAVGPGADGGPSGDSADASGAPQEGGATPSDAGLVDRTYEGREVLVYVPTGVGHGTPVPLVLMLHGCTQTPADFAAGTRMDAQADAAGFIVAYPAEPSSANVEECWNWFLSADQSRGSGEPALLARIVGDLANDYSIDSRRVFAAGLSAGAAMAVVLGATYPDVFAAIGVHSGLEYAAATDASSALSVSANGGPDPKAQGDAAFSAMGAQARAVPVIVFHGDADSVVNVINGQQVASQWAETDDRAGAAVGQPATATGSAGGRSFTQTLYSSGSPAAALLELYVVHGLGHAWSGGSSAGSFTDPSGPDASEMMWQFFAAHGA